MLRVLVLGWGCFNHMVKCMNFATILPKSWATSREALYILVIKAIDPWAKGPSDWAVIIRHFFLKFLLMDL